MFKFVFVNGFVPYLMVLTCVFLISILYYFWFVYRPYAKFPACRLEHRIPYWIFKRIPLNYASLQTFIKYARRYESEGMFAAWFGTPLLFVYGEDIVKKIVTEPAAIDKPKYYELFEYAMGKGIFTRNGELWKKHRKMIAPAFHATALKSYTPIMNEISEEMIEKIFLLKGQPTEDIINLISVCSIGIIINTYSLVKQTNIEECSQIMNGINKTTDFLMKRLFSPWLYFDFTLGLFPSAREALQIPNKLRNESLKPRLELVKEYIISRRGPASISDFESDDRRPKSFMEPFVEQHLQHPTTITMNDVAEQLSIVVAAGFDSVVHTLELAFLLLGNHKDVQDRAFQEVISETEGHITFDDLRKLTYLESVIKETLRLYPPPVFGKYLRKDLQCGKYLIPKNTNIAVFPYMLHRNPEIYPDPETFDPERFMDKNSKITPWNHVPFAEGLRPCIGKNYGMMKMKIMLAHILRNFEIISLDHLEEKDLHWSIVLLSEKKLRMQFVPRKQDEH